MWRELQQRGPLPAGGALHAARPPPVDKTEPSGNRLADLLPRWAEASARPLLAGELVLGDRIEDDIAYTEDLGLVDRSKGRPRICGRLDVLRL